MSGAHRFAKREAIAIHDASIAHFGGLAGVRDEGLLVSRTAGDVADLGTQQESGERDAPAPPSA